MRTRIKTYAVNDNVIKIDGIFTIEDIRLIVDETKECVICSSMNKGNVTITSSASDNCTYITVKSDLLEMENEDALTIEVDKGDSLDEIKSRCDYIKDLVEGNYTASNSESNSYFS